VLPKRIAPKATNLTPEGSLAGPAVTTDQLAQQVRPKLPVTALLGLGALLLGAGLVVAFWPAPVPQGDPKPVITQTGPPEPLVAEKPVDAGALAPLVVALEPVDAGAEPDELTGISKSNGKPAVKPVIAVNTCDDRWKLASEAELKALRKAVADTKDDSLWASYEADEERVMEKMSAVQSAATCAAVNAALDRLQAKYSK